MKKISLLLFSIILTIFSFAQFPNNTTVSNSKTIYHIPVLKGDSAFMMPVRDTLNNPATIYAGSLTIRPQDASALPLIIYGTNGTYWSRIGGGGGGSGTDSIVAGGTITTVPVVGTVINTNITPAQAIREMFFGAQAPTSTLTGGEVIEFTALSTVAKTLNWSASRLVATTTLSSITVAGISQSFVQPSAPATVSGTQAVTVPTNVTTVYSNVVLASNGQSSTSTTTFSFQRKIYAGFVTSSTPTDADVIAAANSAYVGGQFATSFNQSGTLTDPSSSKYVVFASPLSFGLPTIKIQGLTVEYNVTSRTFINQSGYSSSYYILVSPFPTLSGLAYEVF